MTNISKTKMRWGKRKYSLGFTLAEVLITLVVIGVIAAVTVPVIMSDHREKALEAQYQKAKSTIGNAMKLLMIDSGATDIASSDIFKCYGGSTYANASCLQKVSKRIFNIVYDSVDNPSLLTKLKSNTYKTAYDEFHFIPATYAKVPTHDAGSESTSSSGSGSSTPSASAPWQNVSYAFVAGDGIIYGYDNAITENAKNTGFYMVVDVNEQRKPNKIGQDLYRIALDDIGNLSDKTCEYTSSCNETSSSNNSSSGTNNTSNTPVITPTGGCFIAGSKVYMADGSLKNIEDVRKGDRVISFDNKNNKFYDTTVIKTTKEFITRAYFKIKLASGIEVYPTMNHPILTEDGYKTIKVWDKYPELKVGDKVKTISGYSEVKEIAEIKVPKIKAVYNLNVKDDDEIEDDDTYDNFVVDGIVSHNHSG